MSCDFCKENGFVQVDDENALYMMLMEVMSECDLDQISVVADEDVTTELLWFAVNDECNFGSVDLDRYNYDDAYITTISLNYDEDDDAVFEIDVEKARLDDSPYLATDCMTFIQFDLPCKCEYIEDVKNNKYIKDFNPEFFIVGDYMPDEANDEEDKPNEHDKTYTYANHVKGNHSSGDIYIESTSKNFVNALKSLFEEYFGD